MDFGKDKGRLTYGERTRINGVFSKGDVASEFLNDLIDFQLIPPEDMWKNHTEVGKGFKKI
jgi:hypothetical protein